MIRQRWNFGQWARVALLLLWPVLLTQECKARDAFVMLSGGYSPFDNNYSQYLQAKAVLTFFERNYPSNSIWVFFGAGNVQGEQPIFNDVRREVKRERVSVDSWLPGFLNRNRPARHDVIERAFREEILPAVAQGGTLYLFVGDHGSQTKGDHPESSIDLWTLERDSRNERGWRADRNEALGVADLRQILMKGLGKGRVVFCMTQCHAGGFHYLAVPREMTPNPKWFTVTLPAGQKQNDPLVFPRAAGFTATDEKSLAAGCDADPDPETWEGYERYFPETLLGVNLFTLDAISHPLPSFARAHEAATLVDCTIDKPYSTSEQYLERWANLIETKLRTNLTERARKRVAAYQQTVDGTAPKVANRAFRERQSVFRRFTERLVQENPEAKELLLTGTRKELEEAIGRRKARARSQAAAQSQTEAPAQNRSPGQGRRGGRSAETRKLWNDSIRPAWKRAIERNNVTNLPPAVLEFEKHLLAKEAEGRDYLFADSDEVDVEVFWNSGYSDPKTVDLARAEAIALWAAERKKNILAWARTADDATVRASAEKISQMRRRPDSESNQAQEPPQMAPPRISKKVAAERTLFYRRVLGAWEFLLAMDERPALARLRELSELERLPLPKPSLSLK